MQLIAWTLLCAVAAVALRRHVFVLLGAVLVLWCAVPGISGYRVVGPPVGGIVVHPATVLIIVVLLVLLVLRPVDVLAAVGARAGMTGVLVSVGVVAVLLGTMAGGLSALSGAVEQVWASVALFLLTGVWLGPDRGRVRDVRMLVLAVAGVQAALAVIQALAGSPLLYVDDLRGQYWYTESFTRSMGTLDHPLILAMLLAVAVPLLATLRRTVVVLPVLGLLLVGEVLTQSRAGLALALLGTVYVIWSRPGAAPRLLVVAVLGVAAVYASQGGLFDQLAARLADDTGSAAARGFAWDYFTDNIGRFAWMGAGIGSSYDVSSSAGLQTSFENSFVMYTIDIGLIPALMYFATMGACGVAAVRLRDEPGLAAACAVAFVMPLTFSGLAGRTAASCVVWIVFAAAAFGTRVPRPRRAPSRPATPDRLAAPSREGGPRVLAVHDTQRRGRHPQSAGRGPRPTG